MERPARTDQDRPGPSLGRQKSTGTDQRRPVMTYETAGGRPRVALRPGGRRTSRPVRRILCPAVLRPPAAIIHLGLPLPAGSCGLPAGSGEQPSNACAGHHLAAVTLLGLAPGGVYQATPVTRGSGELLPHRFTLTGPKTGGLFSVALSRGSPRVAVNNHPALRSPDVPRRRPRGRRRDRPADSSVAPSSYAGPDRPVDSVPPWISPTFFC